MMKKIGLLKSATLFFCMHLFLLYSFDWVRAGRRLESVIGSVLGLTDRYRDDVIDLDALIATRPEPRRTELEVVAS